jgi:hypothetical protein
MRRWDINRTVTFIYPRRTIFPVTESYQIGRCLYRVSAHYLDNYGGLKPKIERLIRRDLEAGQPKMPPNISSAFTNALCYNVPVNIAYPAAGKEF